MRPEPSPMTPALLGAMRSARSISALAEVLTALPPPIIAFNKSHSGSRLLARVLGAAGVFMGSGCNESGDSVELLPFVKLSVRRLYPEFWRLGADGALEQEITTAAAEALIGHMRDYRGGPWGWKLCETVYIVPVLAVLFPAARFVHMIRDGRDVAFSNHVAPRDPFWQKVYVNAVGIGFWNGLLFGRCSGPVYQRWPHLYNAQHWHNSVTVGRRFGAMLGARYHELRYESLCTAFDETCADLLAFAGLAPELSALALIRSSISLTRVGQFRRRNPITVWRVTARLRPLLVELGYVKSNTPPGP
jgi:hypothetical protein